MADGERYTGSAERTEEIERAAAERSKELREHETNVESLEHERQHEAEEARLEAQREAKLAQEHRPEQKDDSTPNSFSRSSSYKQTLRNIQKDMSLPSRMFSKLIHNKFVDKTSDVIGSTIARPDAILSGAIFAFVLVLGLYALAKYMGFALYGSETIATFIIGWLFGILFDLLRKLFRKRG